MSFISDSEQSPYELDKSGIHKGQDIDIACAVLK